MPHIYTPEYENLGRFVTGLPGSTRHGPFFYGTDTLTVNSSAQGTMDVNQLKNAIYTTPFFIEQFLVAVNAANTDFRDIWVQIKPSGSPPWTDQFIPLWTCLHVEGVHDYTAQSPRTLLIPMPEPYPLKHGESLDVSFWNRGSNNAEILVGLVGYYETEPLYTKPSKIPWIMGDRLANSIDQDSEDAFDSARFTINFERFVAQRMGIQSQREQTTPGGLAMRYAITGRDKVMENFLAASAMKEFSSGMIPLFDTVMTKGEAFEIEALGRDGANALTPVDCAVVGYRWV